MEEGLLGRERMMAHLKEAVGAIRLRTRLEPRVGIIMGTGLGCLGAAVDVQADLPYQEIPHFPLSTVETHPGRLIFGHLEGTPVVAMRGRFHKYEGYTLQQVTFPVRVMKLLGAEILIVSGISGGMNPLWSPGELVLLDDQINLLGDNPLVGENLDELGPRFPDMSRPFDLDLQERAQAAALEAGIRLNRGVYAAVEGPNLETRAEYRMLRLMGADVVGMSTVPEVIVARHMGMRVLGLSIITDACLPDALQPMDVPAVMAAAEAAEPRLRSLITRIVAEL